MIHVTSSRVLSVGLCGGEGDDIRIESISTSGTYGDDTIYQGGIRMCS